MTIKTLCVFCGSSCGNRPDYENAARDLGKHLAEQNIALVYGGAKVGLMGAVADATLKAGGKAIGVIPEHLMLKEVAHTELTELHVVPSMHARKAKMAELSDGFIAMPGGFGTLEEFCEIVTWSQLGLHRKPTGLLNVAGYYDSLLEWISRSVSDRFLRPDHAEQVLASASPAQLLSQLQGFVPKAIPKWISSPDQT